MELLIRDGEGNRLSLISKPKGDSDDEFWASPLSPISSTRNAKMRLPEKAFNSPHHSKHSLITPSRIIEISNAADDLSSKLAATLSELHTRKEESDHVHDLLITRAEKAAERILSLEGHIKELEEDFEANQSELRFMRIQVQAVQVQCAQYLPQNEDVELTQSIMNWKIDWEDIDQRSKARRRKFQNSASSSSSAHTTANR